MLIAPLLAVSLAACRNATAPSVETSIAAVSPVMQSALVGTAVESAPAVIVVDQNGAPMAGIYVTFNVTAGGGTVEGSPVLTDASGVARVTRWTLGSTNEMNSLTATSAQFSVSFAAMAVTTAP